MKTTLNLQDDLLKQAKARAALEHKTLTHLIEEGLSLRLRHSAGPATRQRAPALPVFERGTGVCPGVDPSSNRSMFDAGDADT